MKKTIIVILIIIAAVAAAFFAGKYFGNEKPQEQTDMNVITAQDQTGTSAEETEDAPEETTADTAFQESQTEEETTSAVIESISEEELSALIAENIYCNEIFNIKTLPTVKEIDYESDENLYEVDSARFPDYASFEQYIRSVYCESKAEELLHNNPYEGTEKYTNVDGKLYKDINLIGEKGYYVDWSEFSFTIDSVEDGICDFTLFAKGVEYPGDDPTLEEYSVKGTAVMENGGWRLTEMLY